MGGDNGPEIVLLGAKMSLLERPNTKYLFHGREEVLKPLLDQYPELKAVSEVRHTDGVIAMEEKPTQALRKGRNKSSMWNALQSVADGDADAAISGGNTGALMAMATFCLRPMDGISRPALAAIWPTLRTEIVVLDVGATVGADKQQLVDFSILGAAMARALFDMKEPTVGLLNVGVEEVKGLEAVKDAAKELNSHTGDGYRYHGFVEGDDISKGTVDVVVTEGFTGNIALKAAEGTARQVGSYLRTALTQNWLTKLGALIAQGGLRSLRNKMDPRNNNGAVFLGVNGIVIKSHGGTDEIGFKSALGITHEMAQNRLMERIRNGLKRFEKPTADEAEGKEVTKEASA